MNWESALNLIVVFVLGGLIFPSAKALFLSHVKFGTKHKYDRRLEGEKADFAKEAAFHAAAYSAFANGQQSAMERRLAAIDEIWQCLLHIKRNLPAVMMLTDILTIEEYQNFIKKPDYRTLVQEISLEKINALVPSKAETLQPFLDEYIWTLYSAYQQIFLRAAFLISEAVKSPEKMKWFDDNPTKKLIQAVLSEDEHNRFYELQFNKISSLQQLLEHKMLVRMRHIISGKELVQPSLEQIHLIDKRITESKLAEKKEKLK